MLHIILGILKVIGIILGILLLVLLAAFLAVVFVPLRYRVMVEKKPRETGDGPPSGLPIRAEAKISWLLHIFSIKVAVDHNKGPDIAIRLLGIRLPFFRKKPPADSEPRRMNEAEAEAEADVSPDGNTASIPRALESPTGEKILENAGKPEGNIKSDHAEELTNIIKSDHAESLTGNIKSDHAEELTGNIKSDHAERLTGNIKSDHAEELTGNIKSDHAERLTGNIKLDHTEELTDDIMSYPTEGLEDSVKSANTEKLSVEKESANTEESADKEAAWEPGHGGASADSVSLFQKIQFIIKTIYDKIKRILRSIWTFLSGLTEIPEKVSDIWEKITGVLRKPGELLELAEKLEAQALLGDVLEYLKYLLRHYKPRRVAGYLRFGTGDPALSAQLTGLIYLVLPARADKFTIDTEFNDRVFETELICSGHIRACHGIRVLWQAFRNKKLRRLIRYLRKRK